MFWKFSHRGFRSDNLPNSHSLSNKFKYWFCKEKTNIDNKKSQSLKGFTSDHLWISLFFFIFIALDTISFYKSSRISPGESKSFSVINDTVTVLKCRLWTNVLVLLIDFFHDDISFICFSIYVNEPPWSRLKQTIIVLYFVHANEVRKANFHTYKRSMMSSLLILKDDFDVQFCRVQIFQCVVKWECYLEVI